MIIESNNFSDIYRELLYNVYYKPDYISSPRGMNIKELVNLEIRLKHPYTNLFKNKIRSPKLSYLYPELLWYFSGRNDLSFISKYSKFWNNIANDDGTVNSAYGYLLFNQKNSYGLTEYQWAIESLKRDKYSRQSILRFNKPEHSYFGNKDFVCTLNAIFHIRQSSDGIERLYLTTTMRSQDMWFGIIYDIPFYTLLHQQMHKHLLKYYPNLMLGDFRHYVLSEHIYEKDFNKIEEMLKYPFEPDNVQFDYLCDLIKEDGSPSEELVTVMKAIDEKCEYVEFKETLLNNIIQFSIKD